jgi:ABC-type sugar transport system ATPase subunit
VTIDMPPLLEARGIVKTFPGVRALDGAQLRLRPGRLTALMGENGAGKSTLMNILAGVFTADEGEVLLNGKLVRFRSPIESQRAGVAIIHQELNLAGNLTVAENLFLGREPLTPLGFVDRRKMCREATALLARVGVDLDPNQLVERLSVAQQQIVEIAKALSLNARVLILDEPTSALTAHEVESLFRIIRQLKSSGVALAYITHRFEELDAIADEVTVFRDGKFVAERPYEELTRPELVRLMIGRDAMAEAPKTKKPQAEPLLSVRNLALASSKRRMRPVVDGVSFDVGAGEIVGLFGLMGAGRTELLEALFGVHPSLTSGVIKIAGMTVTIRRPRDAYRAGLALTPEDRKGAGLVLGMSVGDNTTMASLGRFVRGGLLDVRAMNRSAQQYVDRFRVRTPSLRQAVRNLSGGNQQKVVLAKQLATGPRVLLLDEPTRGVDIGAKQEVYALIREFAAEGMGVLVVSSEAWEVRMLSDRVLVMCEGRLTGEFTGEEADDERLLAAALPDGAARRSA